MDEIKKEIENLRNLKRHYDYVYWVQSDRAVDDGEYDKVKKSFVKLLNEYPQYKLPEDDMLEESMVNTLNPVKHKYLLLSLEKKLNIADYTSWLINIIKIARKFIFEFKMDGAAVELVYENGKLISGSTRGDGNIGDDITATVFQINDIPKTLSENINCVASGEIYMKRSSLILLNEELKKQNKKELKNVRNAASGILRQKDSVLAKYLSFGCYKFIEEGLDTKTYLDDITRAKNLGFSTVYYDLGGKEINFDNINLGLKELNEYFLKAEELRKTLDFDIDGMVGKINDKEIQSKLGENNSHPKWAMAYKFPAMAAQTKLLAIEWELGLKGQLTPVAILEPVEVGGTTVKHPTLHNADEIIRLGLKIGDTVRVVRRGDVIPKIEAVILELRTGSEIDIEIPTICPACGHPLTKEGVHLRCDNIDCDGRTAGKISNWVKSLGIENLGDKVIGKLYETDLVHIITDLYSLTEIQIMGLERQGKKSAEKIINNIKNSIDAPLWRVIKGLGIREVGETVAQRLEKKFNNLSEFAKCTMNDLNAMSDIGPSVSERIITWLSKPANQYLLADLIALNIGHRIESIEIKQNKLEGKTFAVTGTLSIGRKEFKNIITQNGGIFLDFKKGLQFAILGQEGKENKTNEAKAKYGTQIITEQDFWNMLK